MAFINEQDKYRTIDYDRDIILTMIGSSRDKIDNFEIKIGDKAIKFGAKHQINATYKDKSSIDWNIINISVPANFHMEKRELRGLIIEALEAYGFAYQTKDIDTVSVSISPSLEALSDYIAA